MRKYLFLIVAILLFGVASAQEKTENKRGVEVGISSGVTSFLNYPPLSLFADNTPDYFSKYGMSLVLRKNSDFGFWGIEIGGSSFNTSNVGLKEEAEFGYLAFTIGVTIPFYDVSKGIRGWEIQMEGKIGPSIIDNNIVYNGERKYYFRWGTFVGYGIGLDYRASFGHVGISNNVFAGGNYINEVQNLPIGLVNNTDNGRWFYGYNMMVNVAFKL